jgi:putative DNA-invertase from lambdoid prophage Rac
MKVAIYARVSTDEQHKENQVPVLENWAKQRGWEVVKVYAEEGSAWHAGHQKELAKLLNDARMGEFNLVIVWALDRLTRAGIPAIFQLYHSLLTFNVKVFSYQESWTETSNEQFPLLLAFSGYIAESESKRRSERTKAGMVRAKENGTRSGKHIGRPRKEVVTLEGNTKAIEKVRALEQKLHYFEKQINDMLKPSEEKST